MAKPPRKGKKPQRSTPSGKARPPHPGEAERITARRRHVYDLRMEGRSYREIGDALGVDQSTVCRDIAAETAKLEALTTEAAENARALDLERIDLAIRGLMLDVRRGVPKAVMALMRSLERRAKLLGLDAPTKLSGPNGEPITPAVLYIPENHRNGTT